MRPWIRVLLSATATLVLVLAALIGMGSAGNDLNLSFFSETGLLTPISIMVLTVIGTMALVMALKR